MNNTADRFAGFSMVASYRHLTRWAHVGMLAVCGACAQAADGALVGERNCWVEAANRYGVSPQVLYAIARTESGLKPMAVGKQSKNGTVDIGMMQINSSWLPTLARFGIRYEDLWEPCLNIHVGAWVLANNIRQHGNTWQAIGAYNAKSKEKQLTYAWKVYRNLASN